VILTPFQKDLVTDPASCNIAVIVNSLPARELPADPMVSLFLLAMYKEDFRGLVASFSSVGGAFLPEVFSTGIFITNIAALIRQKSLNILYEVYH